MLDSLQFILTALGNAILNSLWQTGLLWLLVLLYSKLRVGPSRLSHLSFAALVTGFAAFIITFCVSLLSPQMNVGIFTWLYSTGNLYSILFYSALAYVLLLAIPTVRLLFGIRNVYILRHRGLAKVPGHLKIFLLDASQYLGIKRKVKIFTSTIISSPLTVGFIKPVILLPVAMINQLSMREVEAVILHELAHIRRNDYLKNVITQIILTVLYFNPFAKMLAKMQNLEREKCADQWVLQFEYNHQMYARTLLHLAKQNTEEPARLAIPISGRNSSLLERVEWLLGSRKRRYPSLKNLIACSLFIVAVFSLTLIKKANEPVTLESFVYNPPVATYVPAVNTETVDEIVVPESVEEPVLQNVERAEHSPEKRQSISTEKCTETEVHSEEHNEEITATFVKNVTIVSPALEATEEHKVQEALAATKKVVTELSWKAIENALAETVTKEDKEVLKEAYSKKLEAANWEKQANVLRLHYDNINWEKANENLAIAIEGFKIDSAYNKYKEVAQALTDYRKQLELEANTKKEIKALDDLIRQYRTFIIKVDSLRSKKIVEL